MAYHQKDYDYYSSKVNEKMLMSWKVTFNYQNKAYSGSLFITESSIIFIREKEKFMYKIPIAHLKSYYKTIKLLSYSVELEYGEGYNVKIVFSLKDEPDNFITLVAFVLFLNKRLKELENMEEDIKTKTLDENKQKFTEWKNIELNSLHESKQKFTEWKENELQLFHESKQQEQHKLDEISCKVTEKKQKMLQIEKEIKEKRKELFKLEEELNTVHKQHDIMQTFVNNFDEDVTSQDLKNRLGMLTLNEKEMFKDGDAAVYYGYEDKKKIVNAQLKQILRSFNTECDYMLSNVTAKNYESYHSRIIRAYETLNKIYSVDSVEITKPYLEKKLEKLNLIYQYQIKVQQEKELQREIKEQIKEEERVKREIEQEKKKIEKEETQFSNEVRSLFKRLEKSQSDIEKELYADKIKELENKIKELEEDKKNVLEREANTRAGYVYIISNIGSFGEDIYKIGVTRRLEPYDRVKELGDASVPFEFDVHAMIFSDDAPNLENILHKHFRDREVNKVNHRKEFFKVNIDEIEQVVKENHNNTVEFIKVPVAEQYWQSQNIDELNTDY